MGHDPTPHSDLALNTGGEIAWAMRKDSPLLHAAVDGFVATHRGGTLMGNIILNRYLRSTNWVRNSLTAVDLERFQQTVEFFRQYAGEYDFDWLMVAAQGYQESRLDQSVRSGAGAIGVMQLLPSTAADPNVGIPSIEDLEDNIHAGVKYLRFLRDRYFDDLTPHLDLALNTGGEIAWAMRKDSPLLHAAVDEFVATHRGGTLMGNIILNRYLRSTNWVRNSLTAVDLERFQQTVEFFQQYAGEYDFDWLMVAAQGYQESRLDQSARSSAGAIGVMQLLPSTAADPNVGIPNIEELEDNIHAGVKYLRFLRDRYFADPEIDDLNATLLSFAAYNGGPNRIARLRREAADSGLDPNVWFRNVENIVAKRIGRETVQYVSNIYKYYIAYRLIADTIQIRGQG